MAPYSVFRMHSVADPTQPNYLVFLFLIGMSCHAHRQTTQRLPTHLTSSSREVGVNVTLSRAIIVVKICEIAQSHIRKHKCIYSCQQSPKATYKKTNFSMILKCFGKDLCIYRHNRETYRVRVLALVQPVARGCSLCGLALTRSYYTVDVALISRYSSYYGQ